MTNPLFTDEEIEKELNLIHKLVDKKVNIGVVEAQRGKLLGLLQANERHLKIIKELEKKKMIELADAQFLGYKLGKIGASLCELCSSMGLKKEEYITLFEHYGLDATLDSNDIEEIEDYFNGEERRR